MFKPKISEVCLNEGGGMQTKCLPMFSGMLKVCKTQVSVLWRGKNFSFFATHKSVRALLDRIKGGPVSCITQRPTKCFQAAMDAGRVNAACCCFTQICNLWPRRIIQLSCPIAPDRSHLHVSTQSRFKVMSASDSQPTLWQ